MTARDHRLTRLSSGFTAQERALLVLRALKEGREEDPVWRWSMPAEQAPEFNRLLDLIEGVNERLRPLVLILGLEADKLHLRLGILATLAIWNLQALKVGDYIKYGTERPDGHVLLLKDSLEHAPLRPIVYVSGEFQELLARECAAPTKLDEAAELHKQALREGVAEHGRFLRAVEIVVSEVAEEFGGKDPAVPDMRDLIDGAAERLEEARREAERYTGSISVCARRGAARQGEASGWRAPDAVCSGRACRGPRCIVARENAAHISADQFPG